MRIIAIDEPTSPWMRIHFTLRRGRFICSDIAGIYPDVHVVGAVVPALHSFHVAERQEAFQWGHCPVYRVRIVGD